jgi:tetrapyrrole methylase family protein/MazG family protein
MPIEFEKTGKIDDIIHMVDALLSDDGCPWDRKQTVEDFSEYIRNESDELLEAIAEADWKHVAEETGDLLFICVFLCRVAEKEGKFTLADTLNTVLDKMIRRHPHVFGTTEVADADEVLANWQEIKKKEKEGKVS